MSKMRVYELAKEYNIQSKDFVKILNKHDIPVKNHISVLTAKQVEEFKKTFKPEKVEKESNIKKTTEKPNKQTKTNETVTQKDSKTSSEQTKKEVKVDIETQKTDMKSTEKMTQPTKKSDQAKTAKKTTTKVVDTKKKKTTVKKEVEAPNHKNSTAKKPEKASNNKKNTAATGTTPANKNKNKNKKNKSQNAKPTHVRDNSKRGKNSHTKYKKDKDDKRTEKLKSQVYEVPEVLTVGELADVLDIAVTEIITVLMKGGTMASINQQIDYDTAELVAMDLGFEIKKVTVEDVVSKILEEYDEEETGEEVSRPPVVTIMGHVDHGKTSLLDCIRKTNVTAGEAGGITQHIGAYTVKTKGHKITFIDTPGHEAFTAMRSRGAQLTDIAILVVAADDGVMPQTVEAINHAKAAGVPIIIAINKIDKEGANPERVKQDLTEYGLVVEEWGGDVIAVPVSAKKGENIDTLLEMIILVAEMGELKADPNRAARGTVIEAQIKKGKGSTASLLVQQGALHVGDSIISGTTYGKIRTMIDDKGHRIKKAGPSTPVEISGLSDVPIAGDDFLVLPNEKEARQLAEQRVEQEKNARQSKFRISLDDLYSRIQEGKLQDINIIIKADVQGSIEALKSSLEKLSTDEIRVCVIHDAVGAITESDVMLATTSDAIIIGFNVRPYKDAITIADTENVDIRLYRVIYDAIDDVKQAMTGMLEPEFVERVTGSATVRETFKIPGGTIVAGCYVTEGKINRNDSVRLVRDGIVIYEGTILALRRFKDDAKEVASGFECGLSFENYNDVKPGDEIETFVLDAVAREL